MFEEQSWKPLIDELYGFCINQLLNSKPTELFYCGGKGVKSSHMFQAQSRQLLICFQFELNCHFVTANCFVVILMCLLFKFLYITREETSNFLLLF